MTGDCHVRFCESGRGRFPPATHQIIFPGCRRRPSGRKATSLAALARAASGPRAVKEPVHALSLQVREPGDPAVARLAVMAGRAARGTLRR
jgi:hypothetical protein